MSASARVAPPTSPAGSYAEPTGVFQGPPPNEDLSVQQGFPGPYGPPPQQFPHGGAPSGYPEQAGFAAGPPAGFAPPQGAPTEYGQPAPPDYGQPPRPEYGQPIQPEYGQAGQPAYPPHQPFGQPGGQPGSQAGAQAGLQQYYGPNGPPPGGPEVFPANPADDQAKFDTFKPDAPAESPPAAKERNGRVLAMVIAAAVLILAVPLGTVWLFTRGGSDNAFNPAVGSCVRQSGNGAVAADCGDANAFTVVSKVDTKAQCEDQRQPHIVIAGSNGKDQVLCLRPAS